MNMRSVRPFFLFLVMAVVSCHTLDTEKRPLSKQEAEHLAARIHPGMTLREILSEVPHTDVLMVMATHGGWQYDMTVSPDYRISVRVARPPVDTSPQDSVINLCPALFDMGTGKWITPNSEPW